MLLDGPIHKHIRVTHVLYMYQGMFICTFSVSVACGSDYSTDNITVTIDDTNHTTIQCKYLDHHH